MKINTELKPLAEMRLSKCDGVTIISPLGVTVFIGMGL